jgi:23S rRNA U2552 (ribose-2'-O)-methylase RlmE/FtsJ
MVKKVTLEIGSSPPSSPCENIEDLLQKNKELQQSLIKYKNKITEYYNSKQWDKYKKLSNEYEMVFTTPNTSFNTAKYSPVSRSFFKMWELLYDFKEELNLSKDKLRVCMLCEGPGGFAEALIKYRNNVNDEYFGISLKSNNNKNIPDWKTHNKYLDKIDICYGSDDTGNIYNMCNISYLVNKVGKQSVDLITADGGFDFSSDFNNQEEMSMQLIYCEILTALLLQSDGGSFILKIYDMFTENSLKMLQLLKEFYSKIVFVKPLTSRPANSEKYVVCLGFKRPVDSKKYYGILFELVINHITSFPFDYNTHVIKNIVSYNAYYTLRQMYYIQKTIDMINSSSKWSHNSTFEEHKRKSQKWCEKYNI